MRRRRPRALLIAAICVAAGVTCSDRESTGPSTELLSKIGLAPALTAAATDIFRNLVTFGLELDNVRLQLKRPNGELAKDTVIALGADDTEVRIDLVVQLRSAEERFLAVVELLDGTQALFSGTQEIIARAGSSGAAMPPVELAYIGPGATATSLSLSPSDSAIFTTDSIDFVATALDANEQSVPVVAIAWSVENPALGVVSATGRFKPNQSRGATNVVAKFPTGLTASAHVSIVPPASQMSLVSGGSQTGTVGSALAQPVVVEVRAVDELPVPGIRVDFAVLTGGGSVSSASAITDANGRAATGLTLGTVAGTNSITATTANLPAVTVTSIGKPGKATRLSILQQPSSTAITGVSLADQPKIKLLDVYGNAVNVAGVAVHASSTPPSGPQLAGTLTALTDASGVATFTDLAFSGATGTTALVFAQDTLGSVTSANISVGLGAPSALLLNGATSLSGVAGAALTSAPSVIVKDAAGNHIPGVDVRLTMSGAGMTLFDQTLQTDANGSVSLGMIPVPTVAGSYQIMAASGTLSGSPIQVMLSISHADAAKLAFITQPTGTAGIAGGFLSPIVVELRDPFGNRVTTGPTSQESITLSLGGGTPGALLEPAGATTQTAQNGRATFNVLVDSAGTGYALTASASATITPVTSASFDIGVSGIARILLVSGGEQGVLPRSALADSIVVRAFDASSNPMPGIPVMFAVDSGGGLLNDLGASVQVTTDANGQAAVAWTVGAGQQLLTASMSGASEKVRAYVADRLVIVTEPSLDPQSGIRLVQQPKVRFTDAAGRLIRAGQQLVEAVLVRTDQGVPSGTVDFSTVATDADGVATFTQLTISGPTTEQVQLRFFHQIGGENPDIQAALSAPITLRPGLAIDIAVADAVDRHRVSPGFRIPLSFRVTDGINPVAGEPVSVSLIQGTTSCVAPTVVSSDASGIATVDLTAGPAFTSCRALVQLQRSIPTGQPVARQDVYAVDGTVPLWVGGTPKDADPAGWSTNGNWFDGVTPGTEPLVFVPGAVDFVPRADAALALRSLRIENTGTLDLSGHALTISDSLIGGGWIANAGAVSLTGITDLPLNIQVSGPLLIGEKDKTTCEPGNRAYVVVSYLSAGSLEINCGLEVDGGSSVTIQGDLIVQSLGGSLRQTSGTTFVGRDAMFHSGDSRVDGASFSVAGKLSIGPNARFDQQKGTISVEGDAIFDGRSALSEGILVVKGSFFHTGDDKDRRFVAAYPHVTQLGSDKEDRTITWNVVLTGASKFGRLVVADRTAAGYRFANVDERPAIVDIDDLYVAPEAQLYVPSFFTLNVGGAPGSGVRVDGTLTNDGQIVVVNSDCSPLSKLIQSGFACLSR